MSLAPEHIHRLRRYSWRNQKQWTCLVPFCKYMTRNPLDLLGALFVCTNPSCGNTFRFEEEDVKQPLPDIQCPVCSGSKDDRRLTETTYLNTITQQTALEMLSKGATPTDVIIDPREVNIKQAADIAIAELLKENMEK